VSAGPPYRENLLDHAGWVPAVVLQLVAQGNIACDRTALKVDLGLEHLCRLLKLTRGKQGRSGSEAAATSRSKRDVESIKSSADVSMARQTRWSPPTDVPCVVH
jgi:hypothetical protein